jgi:hypothetical protein
VGGNKAWNIYAGSTDSWLEAEAVTAILEQLPALAEEIVQAVQRDVTEYSGRLGGDFGEAIRVGTLQALRRFLGTGGEQLPAVYRDLGYGEHQAGRSLDALQSAYRIGARLAWRRMSRAAADAGASTDTQHHLAEAMFAYIDQLAGESVDGYAAAQAARAGDSERRRGALLGALLGVADTAAGELSELAATASWTLPATVACLAVERDPGRVARRLSGDALFGESEGTPCVLVGNPAGLSAEAGAAAARLGIRIGLGPSLPLAQARRSLRWAALAKELAPASDIAVAEERLADLALQGAPEIVGALRLRCLAPLAGESERSRIRLELTLRSWLRNRGSQKAVAGELSVHPQTVRYRLGRLRELFGASLEDPDRRFELEAALRSAADSPAEHR